MYKPMWRWMKEAAAIVGCAALILVFAYGMSTDVITLVDAQREQFGKVVSVKGIEFERERGFALQVYEAKRLLPQVVAENPQSFANAIVNVAAIGISAQPGREARLPRAAQARDLPRPLLHGPDAHRAGVRRDPVGPGGDRAQERQFELRLDQQPKHVYKPFATDRGDIIGVYVVVKTDGGDYLTHTMPIAKVYDIRDRSEAWKAYSRTTRRSARGSPTPRR
jgi:recombination protein RecT